MHGRSYTQIITKRQLFEYQLLHCQLSQLPSPDQLQSTNLKYKTCRSAISISSHFYFLAQIGHVHKIVKNCEKSLKKSASANGGPCYRVCECQTLRSAPHRHERKFLAHMSAETPSNISPNPSEVISEVSEPQENF